MFFIHVTLSSLYALGHGVVQVMHCINIIKLVHPCHSGWQKSCPMSYAAINSSGGASNLQEGTVGSRTKPFYNRVPLLHKAEWEYSLPRHSCCKVEVCPCGWELCLNGPFCCQEEKTHFREFSPVEEGGGSGNRRLKLVAGLLGFCSNLVHLYTLLVDSTNWSVKNLGATTSRKTDWQLTLKDIYVVLLLTISILIARHSSDSNLFCWG